MSAKDHIRVLNYLTLDQAQHLDGGITKGEEIWWRKNHGRRNAEAAVKVIGEKKY